MAAFHFSSGFNTRNRKLFLRNGHFPSNDGKLFLSTSSNRGKISKFSSEREEAISKIKPRMRHLINVKKLHFLHF